jgi:hypothetical protein
MRIAYIALISIFIYAITPALSEAVLPPDILFSAGTQLTQIAALCGIMFVAALSSAGAYMRYGFSWITSRTGILFLLLTGLICFFAYSAFPSAKNSTQILAPITSSITEHRTYAALRAVVVGKDSSQPYAFEIDLNARENADGTFSTYYFGEGVFGQTIEHAYAQFTHTDGTLPPHDFLTDIKRTKFPDLSSRERLSYALTLGKNILTVSTDTLSGDFLTKNTPEYMKYESVGTAHVTINGTASEAYIFVSPVFSTDYETYIFTPDYYSTGGAARQFILWDTLGNFYLADQSIVEKPTAAYPSHFWSLQKKAVSGALFKGFEGSIVGNSKTPESETAWAIQSTGEPMFSGMLHMDTPYKGVLRGMTVSGTIVNMDGQKKEVHGTAYIQSL